MFGNASVFDSTAYQPLPVGPEPPADNKAGPKRRRMLLDRASSAPPRPTDAWEPSHASRKRRRIHESESERNIEIPERDQASTAAPTSSLVEGTLWQSLKGCLSLFRDPAYSTSLGCILAASVGTGLIKSGYLMILKGVGEEPLLANEIMDGLQDVATIPAMFLAHYLVDRAAASREAHPDVPQRYMRGLAKCGVVDLALGCGLAGSALAHGCGLLSNHGLLAVVALGQTIDSIKAILNFGYWRCAKLNMGTPHTQKMQRELQMQMIAVEMPFYLIVSYSQSIGVYACALKYAPHNLMRVGALALGVGGAIACLPKAYFWIKAWSITCARQAAAAFPLANAV